MSGKQKAGSNGQVIRGRPSRDKQDEPERDERNEQEGGNGGDDPGR